MAVLLNKTISLICLDRYRLRFPDKNLILNKGTELEIVIRGQAYERESNKTLKKDKKGNPIPIDGKLEDRPFTYRC